MKFAKPSLKSGLVKKKLGFWSYHMPLAFMFPRTQNCVGGVLYAKSGTTIIAIYAIANFIVSLRGVGKRNTLLEIEV
jgi:hypothetical protein